MQLCMKLIFQDLKKQGDGNNTPAGLVAKLKEKLLFHTPHPVDSSGIQI